MDGKQLKNSILQWAIQGKLVPQNPKDEPASKLLERIAAARNESTLSLPKGAKSKKSAPTSRVYCENGVWCEQTGNAEPKDISEDIPFEIPENWAWCRIGDIFYHASGKQQSSSNKSGGTPQKFITTSNLYWGRFVLDNVKVMNFTEYEIKNCSATKGDLLVCEGGAGYGRSAIWDKDYDICLQNHIHRLRPCVNGICEFVYYFIYLLKETNRLASVGTAMPGLSANRLKELILPLPPLAEQKRIVAKLEKVLPLVDEYNVAQEQLDELNKDLPEALKKSILQQAIQGKLVPQNPKDEPAQKLLERIAAARSEGSQPKKSAPTSRIYCENGTWYEQIGNAEPKDISEDIPFEIPENWTWCRMGDFISISTGLAYKKEDLDVRAKSYIRVLRGGNIDYGKWKIKDDDVLIAPQFVKDDLILKKGMFITPAVTSLEQMGKTALVEVDQKDIVVGGFVLMMSSCFNDEIFLKYVLNFFQSYYYKQYCQSITNKSGQAFYNLSRQKLLQCLIPLPPLTEQKRIVTKLEQLFKVL